MLTDTLLINRGLLRPFANAGGLFYYCCMDKNKVNGKEAQGVEVPSVETVASWIRHDIEAIIALGNMIRTDPELLMALAGKFQAKIEAQELKKKQEEEQQQELFENGK